MRERGREGGKEGEMDFRSRRHETDCGYSTNDVKKGRTG